MADYLNAREAKEFQFKDGIALGYQCLLDKKVKFHENNNNIDYTIPTVAKLQEVEGKEGTHFSTTEKVLSSILDALIVDYVDAKESQFKDRKDVAYGNILDNVSELFSVKEAREEAAAGKIDAEDANAVGTDPDSEKAEAAEKDLEAGDAHATAERE
mgnify:CR=1 FL=1